MDPQLIALLGLPDDADAGAVAEAVQALLDKIATLEGAAATATAEADLEAAGVPAEMRDKWRPLLVAHREQTLPLLAAFSEAAKAKAKPPAPPAYKPLDRSREASPAARHRADAPAAAEAHAAKVANRAREIQASGAQAGQPVSYNRAFSLAQQELG